MERSFKHNIIHEPEVMPDTQIQIYSFTLGHKLFLSAAAIVLALYYMIIEYLREHSQRKDYLFRTVQCEIQPPMVLFDTLALNWFAQQPAANLSSDSLIEDLIKNGSQVEQDSAAPWPQGSPQFKGGMNYSSESQLKICELLSEVIDFNEFENVREIAAGGGGRVKKALWKNEVALKVLYSQWADEYDELSKELVSCY
jgi:hypothetical protein